MKKLVTLLFTFINYVTFSQQHITSAEIVNTNVSPLAASKKMTQHSKRFTGFFNNSARKIYEESVLDDPFAFESNTATDMNPPANYLNMPAEEIREKLVRIKILQNQQKLKYKIALEKILKQDFIICIGIENTTEKGL